MRTGPQSQPTRRLCASATDIAARLSAGVFVVAAAFAQAAAPPEVPAELEPWRGWVLYGQEFRQCPFLYDQTAVKKDAYYCAWPGVLRVDVAGDGAQFTQTWQVYAAGWAPLPGNGESWPQDVSEGAKALAVTLQDGTPSVWLEPGRHQLGGRFAWTEAPATLALPRRTGLVALSVGGRAVAWPQRTGEALWLGRSAQAVAPEADALRVQVWRELRDGIPFTTTTRVQLDVAGASREALLARAVPAGFAPMQLESQLPARIEPDGRLRVQLRPGSWHLELIARASSLPEELAFDPGEGDWAAAELWSYASDDALRVTVPESANPVDPAQAGMPSEWQDLPAFRMERGAVLRIVERSRGLSDALENELRLERNVWRDYAGHGYTVQDAISGQMRTGWRLDMRAPYRLGSAQANDTDLLVTQGATPELAGVEVRDGALSLRALGRMENAGGRMLATGWQQRFEGATLTLHLPAGQRLLDARGVDSAPGTWLHEWRLLDFFLVLFIALAAGRLLSPLYGGIALVMLVLVYQEPGAPVWIWLVLLLAVALVRFAPEGRLLRAARGLRLLAFVALALVAVPFAAMQLRAAIYPQLEPRASWAELTGAMGGAPDRAVVMGSRSYARMRPPAPVAAPESSAAQGKAEEMMVTAQRADSSLDYAPSVLVQSGPAVPDWYGNVYQLGWSGPVGADDELRLVILGNFAYRCVRVLSVLLMGVLVYALARASFGGFRWPPRFGLASKAPLAAGAQALLGIVVLVALAGAPRAAQADTPDPALLGELKERLLARPDCAPRCAELAKARVRIDGATLELDLDVQSQARVAFPLPGALRAWEPAAVVVDGLPRDWLYRSDDERLWIVLDEGAHALRLSGPLPPLASLRVPFPEPPRYIEVEARGWTVSGVSRGRLASGALLLERVAAERTPAAEGAPDRLAAGTMQPFVRVLRMLVLGVDWTMQTSVERLAPADGAFTVEIPLLAGEAVTTGAPVRDGRVLAAFSADQPYFRWESTLAQSDSLQLTAGDGASYVEVWRILAGPAWRVAHDGTPLIANADARWMPEFRPRPGESLTLAVGRPAAVEGPTLTFDAASLRTTAGQRVVDSALELSYRSTRGGQHTLRLPPEARVVAVTSDGEALSVRPRDGELTVPIRPGEHTIDVTLQEERSRSVLAGTPSVDVGQETGNVELTLAWGSERWVLFTRGPWDGPAVLLWGELVVFLLLAPLLARLPGMPVRTWQWLLLGIGFGTFEWGMLALLALWFLAFAWRGRGELAAVRWRYNVMQVALAALTLGTFAALLSTILWGALLGQPDMHIVGNGSSTGELHWFADRAAGALPQAGALSLPRWVYQAFILLWALWLSFTLVSWIPWAWSAYGRDGWWRGRTVSAPAEA